MTRLMLDTTAYSAFKRGDPEVVAAVREADAIHLPVVALGEIRAGFESGSRREENLRELREFLGATRVSVLPVGDETAVRYAAIYGALRARGRPVPTNDMWIAASAMEHGVPLLTSDARFRDVPQVLVRWFEP